MNRVWVVGAVPSDRDRPVVGRPKDFDASPARAITPSAETGEQIDCCGHVITC
ncbi:Unknown protein sequence [Pseudomonas syringae pv. maculicola]|nr:Unknown protein sequence [Pseudomonas syringae pv. maculicola]